MQIIVAEVPDATVAVGLADEIAGRVVTKGPSMV